MELAPYYGEKPLTVSDISVKIRSSDRKRVLELTERTLKGITEVKDEDTFTAARRAAGELKAIHGEIYDSKRAAKRPFEMVLASIEDLAKELIGKVEAEEVRIAGLLKGYVKQLEQKKKDQERLERAAKAAEEAAHRQKVRQMQSNHETPEAIDAIEIARALDLEIAAMNQEPEKGLVPGGRVSHPWKFKLVNAEATVNAGCIRLLKIELDILSCQDAVRAQLEIAPDHAPTLPGIEVTQDITVTIKAASRIT
jgi:hypothetical protein